MVIEFMNWMFFLVIVLPSIIKHTSNCWEVCRILDSVYGRFWDKVVFFRVICLLMLRQWLNGSVVRLGKDRYELTFVIKGRKAKIVVVKVVPEIIDIQDTETDESYMESLGEYTQFRQEQWTPPRPSIIYYEDGSTT